MSLSTPTEDTTTGTQLPEAKAAEGASLTLLRLNLWTEEMRLKMRLMSMVVDDAKCTFFQYSASSPLTSADTQQKHRMVVR